VSYTQVTDQVVAPSGSGSWLDVDCSAYIPASATGVKLRVENQHASSARSVGFRKNGSTDDRYFDMFQTGLMWIEIGVDGSQIFETKLENYTDVILTLEGYHTDNATFQTNATSLTLSDLTWLDVDISSTTGAETAIGAIVEVTTTAQVEAGVRKNGSTDTHKADVDRHIWLNIGCDGSEIFEAYRESSAVSMYLVGWITKNATYNTNAPDESLGSTSTWTDLTTRADSVATIIQVVQTDSSKFGLRKNGSSDTTTGSAVRFNSQGIIDADGSGIIEGYINSLTQDFYEVGYYTVGVAASTATWTYDLPAFKKAWFELHWTQDAGNGTTVGWDIQKNSVSQATGTVDMTANGGVFNLLGSSLTDLGADTYDIIIDNDSSGGKVIADAARVYYLPTNGIFADRFREASNTAVQDDTPNYDVNGNGWESSGATILGDQTGVRFDADDDYIQFISGVHTGCVEAHWNPGSVNNNLVLFLMSDSTRDNDYHALVRHQNSNITIYRKVGGVSTSIASVAYTPSLSTLARYKFIRETDGTLTFYVDDSLKLTVIDTQLVTGSYAGTRHGNFVDNTGRLTWFSFATDDTPDITAPGQVTTLVATTGSGTRIDLTWDSIAGASLYRVYGDTSVSPTTILTSRASTNSYSATGLTAETKYYFKVEAIDVYSNVGTSSDIANATTSVASSADSVSGLLAVTTDTSTPWSVHLSWNDQSTAVYYVVYVNGVSVGSTTTTENIYIYSSTSLSDLYSVALVDDEGIEGDISDEVTVRTPAKQTLFRHGQTKSRRIV